MRKLTGFVLTGLLAVASVGTAVAQEADTEAQVEVTSSGTLTATIGTADFDDVPYEFFDQTADTNIVVTVEDATGSSLGWTVSLSGEDFTSGTATSTIPASNLVLGAGTPVMVEGQPVDTGIVAQGGTVSAEVAIEIASSEPASGMGEYNITYPSTLTVPGGTLVGTYTSTLTVSATSAP